MVSTDCRIRRLDKKRIVVNGVLYFNYDSYMYLGSKYFTKKFPCLNGEGENINFEQNH